MQENGVVVVTGAGKGLGRALAKDLARRGRRVVVNNRVREGDDSSAESVVSEIVRAGGTATTETSDVTAPDAGERMLEATLSAYGRLDAVVFNAGVSGDAAHFMEMAPDNFDQVIRTNFNAVVDTTRRVLPELRKSGHGRLVYISSSAGLYGVKGRAPYAASKGALRAFALNMALEEKRYGVLSNLVLPYASTRMTGASAPEEQTGPLSPDSIAPLVSWLASETCELNRTEWMAGGGFVRQIRILESTGARLPESGENLSDWYTSNKNALEDFASDQTGATHAEDAFARFVAHSRTR